MTGWGVAQRFRAIAREPIPRSDMQVTGALVSLHGRSAAPDEMDYQRNDRYDEEKVNQPPRHVKSPPTQQPSHEKDDK